MVAGVDEVFGHVDAHVAKADKSDFVFHSVS
jgi:hypothetical protein